MLRAAIKPGAILRLAVNGTEHLYRVVAVDGGKVVLSKATGGRGRWKLPLWQVQATGAIAGGEPSNEPGRRDMSAWQARRRRYLEETGREEKRG